MPLLALYLLFLPLFSPLDPETVADATVIDYVDDDPFFPFSGASRQAPL